MFSLNLFEYIFDKLDPATGVKPVCPCGSTNPLCFSVSIPQPDTLPMTCMQFVRSAAAPVQANCNTGFRQQVNQLSSFLDGTAIYGSTAAASLDLRTRQGG